MRNKMIKFLCVAPFLFGTLHASDEETKEKPSLVLFEDEPTKKTEEGFRSSDVKEEEEDSLIVL